MRTSIFRWLPILVVVGALAGLNACSSKKAEAPAAEEKPSADAKATEGQAPTGPVARVNGVELPRGDFERQMERTKARFERAGRQIAPTLEGRLKENLIRKVIDDELIRQKAKAEGVAATPEELTAKYDEHKKRFGTEEMYKSFLERTQQTDEDVRKDLESNLVRDKLFAKLMASEAPAPDEAQKYYEENKDKYKQREQIRASHILFKVAATDPADVKQAKEKKAKEVLALAKKAGADFAALAKEHSEGPTAPKGGDLGSFSRGRMVKEFEDAAFTAKIGTVIGPVETKFGYHLIKVFEKTPERERSFDEVKDSITASLEARAKSKATRDILKTMKTEAKIEVLEPGIDLERRRAAPVGADGAALGVRPTQLPVGGAPGAGAAAVQQIKLNAATAKEAGAQEGAAE